MQAACFQGWGLGSPCRRENIVFIIYLIMHLFIHLYFCVIFTDNPCRRDYIKVLYDNVCILYMSKNDINKQCTLQKGKYSMPQCFFLAMGGFYNKHMVISAEWTKHNRKLFSKAFHVARLWIK